MAKYYTPKGRSIQAEGIKPDVIVEAQKQKASAAKDRYMSEKDLKGHLDSKTEGTKKKASGEEAKSEKPEEDYQKKVALDYLKSWQVFQKK